MGESTEFDQAKERIFTALKSYYALFELLNPSRDDYDTWVASLDDFWQNLAKTIGYENAHSLLQYKDYILGKNGYQLQGYLKAYLKGDDYRLLQTGEIKLDMSTIAKLFGPSFPT